MAGRKSGMTVRKKSKKKGPTVGVYARPPLPPQPRAPVEREVLFVTKDKNVIKPGKGAVDTADRMTVPWQNRLRPPKKREI
jgi:hypothetical protein